MAIAASVAGISSTFSIHSTFTAGQGTYSITTGRSFRVLQVIGQGAATSVITVRKNTGAGDTIAACTVDVPSEGMLADITQANANVLATDILHITVATANAEGVEIICAATGGGQALTTANLT
jgi:hypothetical protein